MRYELIDCCPAPVQLIPVAKRIKARSGCTFVSIYRGRDARELLARCGKHDQQWLYDHQGTREQPNPANPPGRSTHELRNDGVAYRGPVGAVLEWWQCGMDVDDAHVQAAIRAAAQEGWSAAVTYPGSAREYHHLNLRKKPIVSVWAIKPLRFRTPRMLGPRVRAITKILAELGYLPKPTRAYSAGVAAAVKSYQREHHQHPDGVVGLQTRRQLAVSHRQYIKRQKEKKH